MLEWLIKGGSMMIPMTLQSIWGVAVLMDRYSAFRAYKKIDNRALRAEILTLLGDNRIEDAIVLAASTPGPVAAVLLVGLQTYRKLLAIGKDPDTIRTIVAKSMEDYHSHAMSAVEKRLYVLSSIGNTAPLFGMCGTVTGMINAFGKMVEAAGLDATLVAGGIMEALITTAAGLIIALFAVIPYNVFVSMADRIGLEIDDSVGELVEFISVLLSGKQQQPSA